MDDASSKTEKPVKARVFIEIDAELKELIGNAADDRGMALNAFIAKLLARFVKRPDLARIPGRRKGRPRKPLSV